jgi:hypothetical protein
MNNPVNILDLDITTAQSIIAGDNIQLSDQWTRGLLLGGFFTYGSGGTTTKCFIQTTFDNITWIDIANFSFSTSSLNKIHNISRRENVTNYTPSDGALGDNTVQTGILGTKLRVKYVTTGTYADDTNLKIWVYSW